MVVLIKIFIIKLCKKVMNNVCIANENEVLMQTKVMLPELRGKFFWGCTSATEIRGEVLMLEIVISVRQEILVAMVVILTW